MLAFKSIVVGVDFTPCSAVALRQGLRMAKWSGADVHPVHVLDTLVVTQLEEAVSPFQKGLREQLSQEVRARYTEFAKHIEGASELSVSVAIDSLLVGLLRLIAGHKADLVVIGAWGTRTPDVGMGTVATACVRKAESPVLVVRDTQHGPFRTVVACVDFSDASKVALQHAAAIAHRDGARLHVLHLFSAPWQTLHYRAPTPEANPRFREQYKGTFEAHLKSFADEATAAHPGLSVTHALVEDPSHRIGILDYVQQVGGDLICLGTRGKTNLRDVLLGSTAEKILSKTPCSVLAVKPPATSA
ncbi:MAG: universal stress protein [Phycisphaeraceae bacterium]|nr:universal stress protein [Phycisphaeraceae bacterium]MCW5753744.1 universal stress protein [Phycisphaeraceae bacterium]